MHRDISMVIYLVTVIIYNTICRHTELFQVIIEYLEDSPDASYEDLLNKIEVVIKLLDCSCV